MGHGRGSYETEVFADSAEEAITIAAEALPQGAQVSESTARPLDSDGNWQVRLKFKGGKKKAAPEPG